MAEVLRPPASFRPIDENMVESRDQTYSDWLFDGTFYQPAGYSEVKYRRARALEYMNRPEGCAFMLLEDYQRWVELDWKKPHGSYAAVERLTDKLAEEAWREAPEAFTDQIPRSAGRNAQQSSDNLVGELGDVLWVITGLASNSGVNINEALQNHLWGNKPLSRMPEKIKLVDLDYIISSGFIPNISPIDEEDKGSSIVDYDEMDPYSNLVYRTAHLRSLCYQQFGYGETICLTGWYDKVAHEKISPVIADNILLIAYYAHAWARATIAEVVAKNIQKINHRVQNKLVDKSDGSRTEEE